jgi:3-oxoacyl-[acyl-carrier protein] reductase
MNFKKESDMKQLEGKVAVVTGASKGIGAGIARAFAEAGASVVVNYASDEAGAVRAVEAIRKAGGKATAVQGDVARQDDVRRIFAAAREAFGRVDILVNNAGVYKFHALEEVTEAEWRREFEINVLGTILATQEAVKQFGDAGGSVVNVSSVVGSNPFPGTVVYSATKAAVDNITLSLARELAPRRIRVNAVAPGATRSEGAVTLGMVGSDMEKQIVSTTPFGRLGEPDDIARAALFLASDQAAWITGETIRVAGGLR